MKTLARIDFGVVCPHRSRVGFDSKTDGGNRPHGMVRAWLKPYDSAEPPLYNGS